MEEYAERFGLVLFQVKVRIHPIVSNVLVSRCILRLCSSIEPFIIYVQGLLQGLELKSEGLEWGRYVLEPA